tara:strand:- start:2069 stop:2899 length:831 start_codon:yes stop_codon:yes gene_type:complete
MNKRDLQAEKPSFFSMRSPTLDAIARKLKSMITKKSETKASDSILQSAKRNKNSSDDTNELPKPQATISNDKSNTTTDVEPLKLPNSNSVDSDEKNTVSNTQSEGQISTKSDNIASKEDLNVESDHSEEVSENPLLADDTLSEETSSHESNESKSKNDPEKDVSDSKESAAKSSQTDDLLKPTSAQKNEAKHPMDQPNVSQGKPSSVKNDIKDAIETVVKEDFNEQTNFLHSDLDSSETFTGVVDKETGVVAKTLFKPNSVLGKLDDQILKSFSQK